MCIMERAGSDHPNAHRQFRCLFSFLTCLELKRGVCVFLEEILGGSCSILRPG